MTKDQSDLKNPEETNDLADSVVARVQWTRRALSPWVQRWLQPGGGPEAGGGPRLYGPSMTALTTAHTARLLQRVGRTFEPQTLEVAPEESTDLILAGSPVQHVAEAETPPADPMTPRQDDDFFAGMPSLAEVEAKVTRQFSRRPPQIEPVAAERPGARQPVRTRPLGRRIVSRVEEVLPPGEISPAVRTPDARPGEAEPDRTERAPEQARVAEAAPPSRPRPGSPARPPPAQRQPVEEVPPGPETPGFYCAAQHAR